MNTFEIKSALEFGWNKTKEHFTYFVGLLVILFAATVTLNALASIPIIGVLIVIAGQTILNMGILKISLVLGRGMSRPSYKELFTTIKPFWVFLGASLLMGLLVAIGMVLLVVPGIIAAITLQFATYLVIDKNLGVVEALKESARITQGNRWKLLGVMIVLALVNVIGGLLFGIGLLLTIPMTLMAMVFIYDALIRSEPEPTTSSLPKEKSNTLEQLTTPGVA